MTRLAHISDVHFGREDGVLVEGLLAAVRAAQVDVVVVSGDLTQRARKAQFRQARAFLRDLPRVPRLVVPGNHDVSATNLLNRLARPLKRYRRYITEDLSPYVEVEGVAIAGINTVRVLAAKDGRINRAQVATACEQLGRAGDGVVRVVVTHHPMDLPMEDRENALVTRAKMAMEAFAGCGVDLFLSGHLHAWQTVVTSARYAGYGAVVAQAGTAVSTRTRGVANGWNLIDVEGRSKIVVREMVWDGAGFVEGGVTGFLRGDLGWEEG